MNLSDARDIATAALDKARELIDKANETGEWKYVSEAIRVVDLAEKEASFAQLEAQDELMASLDEGESVVSDRSEWHRENLETSSYIYFTIKRARSVCDCYSRNVHVPSPNVRIIFD